MKTRIANGTLGMTVLALAAGAVCLPAAAATSTDYVHHRHYAHRAAYHSSDVTVRKSSPRQDAYAHDAFHGPAAIITAPVAIAGTFVTLPFRALDVVFPPRANDPRILVGAPVHFAGQIATFPFYAVDRAFGAQPDFYNYN